MKKLLCVAFLIVAPTASFAQSAAPDDTSSSDAAKPQLVVQVQADRAPGRPRSVRVAVHPRSLTVAISQEEARATPISNHIGG